MQKKKGSKEPRKVTKDSLKREPKVSIRKNQRLAQEKTKG
jgi:hypothetical protein